MGRITEMRVNVVIVTMVTVNVDGETSDFDAWTYESEAFGSHTKMAKTIEMPFGIMRVLHTAGKVLYLRLNCYCCYLMLLF